MADTPNKENADQLPSQMSSKLDFSKTTTVFRCKVCESVYTDLGEFVEHKKRHVATHQQPSDFNIPTAEEEVVFVNDPVSRIRPVVEVVVIDDDDNISLPGAAENAAVGKTESPEIEEVVIEDSDDSITDNPFMGDNLSSKANQVILDTPNSRVNQTSEESVNDESDDVSVAPSSSLDNQSVAGGFGLCCPLKAMKKCNFKAPRQIDILRHVDVDHYCYRPFPCSECNFVGIGQSALSAHEVYHRTPDVFKCGFCTASFRNMRMRNNHLTAVHPGCSTDISLQAVVPRKAAVHDPGYYDQHHTQR